MKELRKEMIKKELKKGFETLRKYYEIEKQIRKLNDETRYFWQDNKTSFEDNERYEKLLSTYREKEKEIKNLKNKNAMNENIINIIKNNLKLRIIEILKTEVFEDLKKYANKNIGEKTRDKIIEEVEAYFENEYNLIVNFSFRFIDLYGSTKEISIEISVAESYTKEKGWNNREYKAFKNYLSTSNDRNIEILIYYLEDINQISRYENAEDYTQHGAKYYKVIDYINGLQYVNIENINTHAKKLVTEKEKAKAKIEKLKREIEATKNAFNNSDFTKGFLHNNYIEAR